MQSSKQANTLLVCWQFAICCLQLEWAFPVEAKSGFRLAKLNQKTRLKWISVSKWAFKWDFE